MTGSLASALTRYRTLAYIVGVGLILLVFVAMPLKYFAHSEGMVAVVGTLHGFLYIVYLLTAIDLTIRCRWSPVTAVFILLAGTIPFLSFVAERRVTADVRGRLAAQSRVA